MKRNFYLLDKSVNYHFYTLKFRFAKSHNKIYNVTPKSMLSNGKGYLQKIWRTLVNGKKNFIIFSGA